LLGYFKYPKNCNFQIRGDCRYKVSWMKEPKPNEIRFVIEVKGVNSTAFGFSPIKTFVRIKTFLGFKIDFLTNSSSLASVVEYKSQDT